MRRSSDASGDNTFCGFGGALASLVPSLALVAVNDNSEAATRNRLRREGLNRSNGFSRHLSHIGNSVLSLQDVVTGCRYSVCTSTTPETALIAPAICGETLKRPGSFISTSV